MAREGKVIEREARNIKIFDICDISIKDTEVSFRVDCSKGTYIRTLCQDIGERLGCGAHMTSLIREKSGSFDLSESVKLADLDVIIAQGNIEKFILDVDKVFLEYPEVNINEESNKWLYNGNKLTEQNFESQGIVLVKDHVYRIYDSNNRFVGLYTAIITPDCRILKPKTLFI